MKGPFYKSLLMLAAVLMMISLACSMGTTNTSPTATPKVAVENVSVTPTDKPTEEAKPTEAKPTQPEKSNSGAVASLDDVKNATIQIEAEGTFIDPEFGLVLNGAGRGSGFIIDPSGIAVTNNHVVTGSAMLKVWVGGNKEKVYSAKVLGASECSDLAVIQIEGSDFPYLNWYKGSPKVGLEVYAAGYPLGDPEFTLTKGIVSKSNADGKTGWASVGSVLEHDARINPGNSGGPLVDKEGSVVGINYASNQNNQYFAIARQEADKVISQLQGGKNVTSIGVNGQVVMSDDKTLSGVWVSSVQSGSPADKSGVKPGDIITHMEGLVLGTDGTMGDYCQILRSHKETDTLSLTVLRWQSQELLEGQLNGREMKVTATYSGSSGSSSSSSSGSSSSSDTSIVTDNDKVISMEVPSAWEYDGSNWTNTWTVGSGSYDFTAQTLTASSDVNAYSNGWDTPGIFVATSQDWGNIGGYANLLEGVQDFYKECKNAGIKNYKDKEFEGMLQMYNKCGDNKTNAIVLALRPIVNSQAYLVLVEMKYSTQEELDLLDAMLATTNINQ